jgi:pterin-4a-carbinolamine dehydratase
MIDQTQRFQIARRFEFNDQGAALHFVRRLADLHRDLGGHYELDLTGNTLTVRIAAAPLQAESSATLMRRLESWYYG